MNLYFKQFPVINYQNKNVVDITRRIKSIDSINSNPFIFYPYNLSEYERLDNVANDFFDDPYAGWVISLTNEMIDPYFDWYMNSNEFNEFIIKKYGSIESAMKKIIGYRNNWYKYSEDRLSIDQRNMLSFKEYRYWEPVIQNNTTLFYKRKSLDEIVNTNIIIKITVINSDLNNNLVLNKDDIVQLKYLQENITGTIVMCKNNDVYIQHISNYSNEFDYNNITSIYANNIQYDISNIEIYHRNIPLIDIKYFDPFSIYDIEQERNEYNKTIRILNPSLIPNFIENSKMSLK